MLGSGKDLALMLSDPSSFALRMVCVITGQIESRSLSVFKSEQVWLGFCFLSFFFFLNFSRCLDVSEYLCGGQEQMRNKSVFGESAGSAPLCS